MKFKDITDLELDVLIPLMRSLGILSIKNGETSLTLTDKAPLHHSMLDNSADELEDELKKEICECGHPHYEHNDLGLCLNGCDDCKTNKEEIK